MWLVSTIVGSKLGRTVGIVLAVGLILFLTIQYIQMEEKDKVLKEVETQQLQEYKRTREKIDEGTTFNNSSAAREFLLKRNESNKR